MELKEISIELRQQLLFVCYLCDVYETFFILVM